MSQPNDVLKSLGIIVSPELNLLPGGVRAVRITSGQTGHDVPRVGMRKSMRENLLESLGLPGDEVRKALAVDGDQGYESPSIYTTPSDTHAESIQGPLPGEVQAFMDSATEVDYFNPRHGDDHAELNPVNMAASPQLKFIHGNKSYTSVSHDDLMKAFGAFDAEDGGEGEDKKTDAEADKQADEKGGKEFRTKGPGSDKENGKKVAFGGKPVPAGPGREKEKLKQAEQRKAAETPEAKKFKSALDDVVDLIKGNVVKGDLAWMQHPGDATMMYARDGVKTIFSPNGRDHLVTVDGNHVSYTHSVGEEVNSLTRTFNTEKEALVAGWTVAVSAKGLSSGKLDHEHVDEAETHGDHERGKRGGIQAEGHNTPTTGNANGGKLDSEHVDESGTHGGHEGGRAGKLGGHAEPLYGTGSGKLDAGHVDESETHGGHKSMTVLEVFDSIAKAFPGYPGSEPGEATIHAADAIIGHASNGHSIHLGKPGSNSIARWGVDSSGTPGRYTSHEGDHAPYGGENHHVFYHHLDCTKHTPHKDYLGHVVKPQGEGHWRAVYNDAKPNPVNFGSRNAAENHLLDKHAAKFKGPKLKINKGEVADLLKAAEDKMEQTMHEFKHGTLHSGSKKGPKVQSRAQAIAIGLKQAGESNKSVSLMLDLSKAKLDTEERKKLPKREFGLPKEKAYPMEDHEHAANAKARASEEEHKGKLSPGQEKEIDAKANRVLAEKSALDETLDLLKARAAGGERDDLGKSSGAARTEQMMTDPKHEQGAGHAKSGPGSRGGKVIGKTKSGKPIYSEFGHPEHAGFNSNEHREAGLLHSKLSAKVGEDTEQGVHHFQQHEKHVAQYRKTKSEIDDVLDLLKAAKEVDTTNEIETAEGHHKHKVKVKEAAKGEGFIKAVGPGGVLFDFGVVTDNPIANRLMLAMNQHGEQTQRQIIGYQDATHRAALVEYVEKGEAAYSTAHPKGGNEEQDPDKLAAIEKGKARIAETSISLGREQVVARSETDAAVIEMAKAEGLEGFAAMEAQMMTTVR